MPSTFSISTLFTFIGLLPTTITFDFAMFILRPIRLLSCSIGCSSCGVSVHKNISSAKRRLVRNSPSIFTPLFSQFNRLNILSSAAMNNLGEKLSPCFTHLLILIFSLSLCRCSVAELSVFHDFYVRIFYSLLLQMSVSRGIVLEIHERNTQWYVVFAALLFKFVYGMYVICRRVLAPKSCLLSRLIFIQFLLQPSGHDGNNARFVMIFVCEQFVHI